MYRMYEQNEARMKERMERSMNENAMELNCNSIPLFDYECPRKEVAIHFMVLLIPI